VGVDIAVSTVAGGGGVGGSGVGVSVSAGAHELTIIVNSTINGIQNFKACFISSPLLAGNLQHRDYYTQGGHKLRFFISGKPQFVTVGII
jgi:hypothetical protein